MNHSKISKNSLPLTPLVSSHRHKNKQLICSKAENRSIDNEEGEENDKCLEIEFEQWTQPEKSAKAIAHLNLVWSVSEVCFKPPRHFIKRHLIGDLPIFSQSVNLLLQRKRPELCDCCHGQGDRECLWCHGTGVMTVGDLLFCDDNEGCRPCPVCHGSGSCKCENCRGTGKRAPWMTHGQCPTIT